MIELLVRFAPSFAQGAAMTLIVSSAAIALGAGPGILLAFGILSKTTTIRAASSIYRSFWRGTPILVQLLVVFYLLPTIGINIHPVLAAIIALALNTAAFQGEIYRAGLQAIPRGQVEAAHMLGLSEWRIRTRLLLPQTFRLMLPALVSEIVIIIKNSSLVSVIAVTELTRVSQQVASNSFRPLESYLIAGIIYLGINLACTWIGIAMESRLSKRGGVSL